MALQRPRRRFTVTDYERMMTAGILTEGDDVELVAGEIIEISPIGVRHMQCVNRLNRILGRSVGAEMLVSIQNPIQLLPDSQPQPDLAILYDRRYDTIPAPSDVLLVIEVADSSRDYDRGTKFPLYAAAGIAEAWLVDLGAGIVERHTEPDDGRYRFVAYARLGETLISTVLPAITIPAEAILG